jgi:hypothetical protein
VSLIACPGERAIDDLSIVARELLRSDPEGKLLDRAGEAERGAVVRIVDAVSRSTPTSKVSSNGMANRIVRGIFIVAASGGSVQLGQMALDLAHCHAARVEAQNLVIEAVEPGLALGDQLRLEAARPVARDRDVDLAVVPVEN